MGAVPGNDLNWPGPRWSKKVQPGKGKVSKLSEVNQKKGEGKTQLSQKGAGRVGLEKN